MQEQTTLGGRIQEGRRAAGLSQEALGERLGVSRQAVSKWESDAAVPELENLIAMSRLFAVSVGRLLGVEPEDPGGEVPREGLTDRELQAAEAIAAKYAEAAGQGARRRRLYRALAWGGAAAVLLGLAAAAAVQLTALERRLNGLQGQVNGIQSSMEHQIASITGRISAALEESHQLLSEAGAAVTGFDLERSTVTLAVSARPRERTADTTARFTARLSDGTALTAEGVLEGDRYVAAGWTVPMDGDIALSVALTQGDTVRTEGVDTLYDCAPERFRLTADAWWMASWTSTKPEVYLGELNLQIENNSPYGLDLSPAAADLCFYRNGETAPERTVPVTEVPKLWRETGRVGMEDWTGYETALSVPSGDEVAVALRLRDNFGNVTYRLIDVYAASDGGWIESLPVTETEGWTPGVRFT
ncbi:helix-turn-helix transcriptional regulator [uncultured Oscillibacter sp.]|uniref:helix-turn-helix domain-containing protein n=1 Tax=uncultured Oscillibacter sp. TaxID=876091 RepID=UPI0028051D11|nr:helix-turn-helix transcriptional regulator [uncultured Oscillibacter sp.]